MDSILYTIKKLLGIDSEYTAFDTDIITGINSALMALSQLGVGPAAGFLIQGSGELWSDFLGSSTNLEAVKSYIHLKVKAVFDPPSSSFVVDSTERSIAELEWRLALQAEQASSPAV